MILLHMRDVMSSTKQDLVAAYTSKPCGFRSANICPCMDCNWTTDFQLKSKWIAMEKQLQLKWKAIEIENKFQTDCTWFETKLKINYKWIAIETKIVTAFE